MLRTSGLATTQSTTSNQEAKDFKVVVTLSDPPQNLRPGLSTTAKIKTASRQNVLAIPIQALAVRTRKDLGHSAFITLRRVCLEHIGKHYIKLKLNNH